MHSSIHAGSHVIIRLPSDQLKVVIVAPNTIISLGKFGTFSANLLIGRPFNLTYEIIDGEVGESQAWLRVVSPSELHAESLVDAEDSSAESREGFPKPTSNAGVQFDIVAENGEFLVRSNRLTIDDPARQLLSMNEIEELKKVDTGSGKDIIKRIMAAHSALNEKTEFSLAKYTLRKSRKYLKRFSVQPMDVSSLVKLMTDKESHKIMDLRDETLGIICSWANVHAAGESGGKRLLAVDDTGGLVIAALADRMGILYPEDTDYEPYRGDARDTDVTLDSTSPLENVMEADINVLGVSISNDYEEPMHRLSRTDDELTLDTLNEASLRRTQKHFIQAMSAISNTITVLHAASQPNLSLLKYFAYDLNNTSPKHPLYTHLKTLSWLQLLHPDDDASYAEPEVISDEVLRSARSGKRANYFRKRRRWERVKTVVDSTRAGKFDGLVVATWLELGSLLKHTLPLLKGGAQVVIYSPSIDPLLETIDLFSRDRKNAYIQLSHQARARGEEFVPDETDFPINPNLLLAPIVQTVRARQWQVLPGRTHPMMTSRGSAEGFVMTATKVLPIDGKVEARGNFAKKRKL